MKLLPTIKKELVYVTSLGQGRYAISTVKVSDYDFIQSKKSLYWLGQRIISWS